MKTAEERSLKEFSSEKKERRLRCRSQMYLLELDHFEVSQLVENIGFGWIHFCSQEKKILRVKILVIAKEIEVDPWCESKVAFVKVISINAFREVANKKRRIKSISFKEFEFWSLTFVAADGFDTNGRLLNVKISRYRSLPWFNRLITLCLFNPNHFQGE